MNQILKAFVVLAIALSSSVFATNAQAQSAKTLAGEDLLAGDELLSAAQNENRLAAARISRPILDSRGLQRRFGISRERANKIFVGSLGKANVIDFFATTDPGDTRFICIGSKCACFGDDDCNNMFTTVCADPDTNGSCTGDICTCTP